MKKVLSMILSLILVVSLFPMGAVNLIANAEMEDTDGYYTYTVTNGEATVISVDDTISGKVTIPSKLGGYTVTRIGEYAFALCENLTSVTIPDSVTSIGESAFSGCYNLTSVTIPDSVTSIGESAFSECYNLTSVTLPNSVTEISFGLFAFCTNLKNITIPDSVTTICGDAFYVCYNLTSITIPNSVISIDSGAFAYCDGLTNLVVASGNPVYHSSKNCIIDTKNKRVVVGCKNSVIPGDGEVTSIGYCAFYYCSALTSIVIPDGITEIGCYAFLGCESLTSITIPDSVTSIGERAFFGCSALTSIVIPDGVTSIGEYMFSECSNLKSVTIPDSVTSIGESAFAWCENLTSVTIPDSVTSIGEAAFNGSGYYYNEKNWKDGVLYAGRHLIEAKESKSGSYTIKDGTLTIGESAFAWCENLTSVTIPDSVKSIGVYAFSGCESLTSVNIPDSVARIGYAAFDGCLSLEKITLPFIGAEADGNINTHFGYIFGGEDFYDNDFCVPRSLKEVVITKATSTGEFAFYGCSSLESVVIHDGVTSIDYCAFSECVNLTSVTIPNSVTSIGNAAFEFCESLTSITIPDSVISISGGAFYESGYYYNEKNWKDGVLYAGRHLIEAKKSKSGSYTIKDGTLTIGELAFAWCENLTSIIIPDSVTSIGEYAFSGCESLTSVNIPDSVTSIGGGAFYESGYYYNEKNWKDGVLYAGRHLIEAKESKSGSYTIKDGTLTIGESAFAWCENLTSVTIPDSVTSIGEGAFSYCKSLSRITIPDSVTSIDAWAFEDCTGLTDVWYTGSEEDRENIVFEEGNDYLLNATWHYNTTDGQNEGVEGYYTYIVTPQEEAYITAVDKTISGDITIPSTLGGYPVIKLGHGVFENCENITGVSIPDCVEYIDHRAFIDCINLTSINLPDSAIRMMDNAFYNTGYYNNEDNWEDDVLYIGKHLLEVKTTKSGSYTIKDGTLTIAGSAFSNCENITSIIIPDGLISMGDWAFAYCSGLTSIAIPDSITEIRSDAFAGCSDLTNIAIPDSITEIRSNAFAGCSDLTNITIGKGVTSIGYNAFGGCASLTSVNIPNSVTSIGEGAFRYCTNLTSLTVDSGNPVYHSSGNCIIDTENKEIVFGCAGSVIPNDGTVISIGYDAFAGCESLTSITIPDSITKIGDFAFYSCEDLESINLPDSAINIGSYVFNDTSYYDNEDNWEDGVLYIGKHLIETDSEAVSGDYAIKEGTLTIATDAFAYCEELTSITIPDSVKMIGTSPFFACADLESITVDDNNTVYRSIGNCLIDTENKILVTGCKNSIIPVDISITSIATCAFYRCSSITDVIIPDGVTSIDEGVFAECSNLTSVIICDGVTEIDQGAFYDCRNLTSVTIPKSVTSIDYCAFYESYNITDVWYTGTERDREEIDFSYENDYLEDATWHYNTCADKHSYTDCFDATCNECEFEREITGHTFDNDCDPTCNDCDFERETGHIYGDDGFCDKCGQPEYIIGDVDGDGELDDWDGVVLARYLADWDVEISVLEALDIDGNGEITDWDGVMLDRYLAGWDIQIG